MENNTCCPLTQALADAQTIDGEESDKAFDIFRTPSKFQAPPKKVGSNKRKSVEVEENPRSRTPSGQVLSTSVGDIANYIEQQQTGINQPHKRPNYKGRLNSVKGTNASASVNHDQRSGTTTQLTERNEVATVLFSMQRMGKQDQSKDQKQHHQSLSIETTSKDVETLGEENARNEQDINSVPPHLQSQSQTDLGAEMQENLTMDIRTVVKMIENLKIELKTDFQNTLAATMEKIPTAKIQETHNSVISVQSKVGICEAKERMIIDTLAGLSDKIKDLENRVELNEVNNNKKTVILSGFQCSDKKKVARLQIMSFFVEKLDIDVVVEEFYMIGGGTPRDIVIQFLSANHKRLLFQNISKIKNLRNSHGKKYIFRDS